MSDQDIDNAEARDKLVAGGEMDPEESAFLEGFYEEEEDEEEDDDSEYLAAFEEEDEED